MSELLYPRRRILAGMGASVGGLLLSGCDKLNDSERFRSVLKVGEKLHYGGQRLVTDRMALAKEFAPSQMSPVFRTNGNTMPESAAYQMHATENFTNWSLEIGGLVANPLKLTHSQMISLPTRTQITRHDCVEGWSAIGKWSGPQLSMLLRQAGVSGRTRYIVFHCADNFGARPYYESIDMIDALHPQTILAWRMNDEMISVAHGAPIRLRVERQLGYKQAKYVMRIEARDRIDNLYDGKGGYWEDAAGYEWYAGI
ncbi:molybdopterin-dependent oxidoreductase [Sphingorhabdus soli]|uniref:Molybdopterin-dependent oxidoreductase n=1 Tax=Flavisphingopyxis soli TaxID=2601267 RepID=A0A5C6U7R5_9SPHN|nr:molybdopterin-dependent oxidoreductase [Sphingorhabdus soli]TXC68854.1 molybdopterin-dependent oxidoreductase [Sphingorhabdus soli]